jgi:hypothetical protein
MKSILKRAFGVLVVIVGAFVILCGFEQETPDFLYRYGLAAIGGGIIGVGTKMAKKPDRPPSAPDPGD